MILLILCKIYDERFTAHDQMVRFRASIDESDEEVSSRINGLFADIQQKYDDVLNKQDAITFDGKTLKLVVGKLQNICITETDRDSVGDAFEVFIGHSLKGSQGQFFTPKNVVRLMVEIVAPDKKHTIIDPACGSCGFLVESLKYLWHTLDETIENEISRAEEKMALAIKNIRGIEKDSFLTKVGKAYMTILGDGKGGIFCEDSLELPKNWGELTKSQIKLESFDISFSNPPFGKDIRVTGKDKLAQYALNLNKKEGNVSTLFLERNLQLLKKGGRLAIILPETYFHAPSTRYVREFLYKHNIEWLIDIPHNTFRPHNNAKCIILILQKDTKQQKFIHMAVAEFAGHDHNGKVIYNVDGSVKDDTLTIIDEVKGRVDEKKYTFEVEANKVIKSDILIPRYFWKSKEFEIADIAHRKNLNMVSLQELIDHASISFFDGHGSPRGELKGEGSIPYIRVKDIVNWQIYKDPTAMIPSDEYDRLFSKAKQLKPKDILFVKRGSYRIGSVAMVSKNDTDVILTREILVLRVNTQNAAKQYGITPEYLLYAMSHIITYKQLENKIFIDTTLPNIADRWRELKIPIPKDASQLEQITKKVKSAITKQWEFLNIVDDLKNHNDVFYT
ncbi:N-6 DNA methylase [Helicobacter heilmannii]|nr:N-6 DNA methylase [Helicobacter heilmannii]